MNASEGLKRLAIVIRWIGLALGLLILVPGIWLAVGHDNAIAVVLISVSGFALFAGGGWLAAWIIDGFASARERAGGDKV